MAKGIENKISISAIEGKKFMIPAKLLAYW